MFLRTVSLVVLLLVLHVNVTTTGVVCVKEFCCGSHPSFHDGHTPMSWVAPRVHRACFFGRGKIREVLYECSDLQIAHFFPFDTVNCILYRGIRHDRSKEIGQNIMG